MVRAVHAPLPPELGPVEIDSRSVNAFRHGYPHPLVRWHIHHDYELHLIEASTGKMFVGDHIGTFSPGQLVMTGPDLPHNWVSDASADVSVNVRDSVIQFRKNLLSTMAAHAPELAALLPLLERSRCGIEFHGGVLADAEARFEAIIATEGAMQVGLLIEFLGRLSRERDYRLLSTSHVFTEAEVVSLDVLNRVIRHITEYHGTDLRIASAAELVGMSSHHFSRFFHKLTGHSFTQFLNRVRVAHACKLLSESDKPITEIAFAVGYNNIANFNRRFLELKNLTPRAYRKQSLAGHRTHPIDPS